MARLKIRRHQQDFTELLLEEERPYFIGRKEGCDVVLQSDPGISRQHLELRRKNNIWTIYVLSQHVPISYEGKNVSELTLDSSPLHFVVQPYEFIFEDDTLSQENDVAPNEDSRLLQHSSQGVEHGSEFNRSIPSEIPVPNISGPSPDAINPEVSFHGNEEKTGEININGEPYLKFMFSTHSESIRLKGNKWIAGRDSIAQIHLDDKKASRQHFSLEKVGEQFFIKDLKSANGTLLNGQELVAHEAKELKSGDIITVNQLTMIFEIRDLSFTDKLKDLPLQAYSGPMILTSQDWYPGAADASTALAPKAMSATQLGQLPGTAQRLEPKKNKLRMALMGVVAVIVLIIAFTMNNEPIKPETTVLDGQLKAFEQLKPEEQKLVLGEYASAQEFEASGKIESALSRLSKIHSLVPFYKDSKEMEARLVEARETVRQQEFIKQQQREQEATKAKVAAIVADCRDRYATGVDANAAKSCLAEALQLDPENIDAHTIVAEIEMRLNQAMEAERQLKDYNDSVDKGRELFSRAKNYLQNKEFHDAINAFSAHINSNLPDPDNLKPVSKRAIASIEHHITSQREQFMGRARSLETSGNLRDAITNAEMAKKIDPYDYSIANFIERNRRELEARMRNIYSESVIEEKFGNVDISKVKWKEIISKDIPTGEYYLKAKRKLQQYGL
ncbi:MAG: FHA domain-containing protein [Bdellovibrionaceae bacterium]|nr:FHA domain-containing protein [Pseudobdellovibrionaceae bacterium]